MKIDAKPLRDALAFVAPFIPGENQAVFGRHVRLREGLHATDYHGYAQAPLPLNGLDVCVNGSLLKAFLDRAGEEVELALQGNTLRLKSGTRRASLAVTTEYPAADAAGEAVAELAGFNLQAMIDSVAYAQAKDDIARRYLEGVLLQRRQGELATVAADGGVMAIHAIEHAGPDFEVILSGTAINRVSGIQSATVYRNLVRFACAGGVIDCPLIAGSYPDWRRIRSAALDKQFTCEAQALKDAVASCAAFADGKDRGVSLDLEGGLLKVRAGRDQTLEAELPATGDAFSAGFKAKQLLDLLPFVGAQATFRFKDALNQFAVKNGHWEGLLMPLRL